MEMNPFVREAVFVSPCKYLVNPSCKDVPSPLSRLGARLWLDSLKEKQKLCQWGLYGDKCTVTSANCMTDL